MTDGCIVASLAQYPSMALNCLRDNESSSVAGIEIFIETVNR